MKINKVLVVVLAVWCGGARADQAAAQDECRSFVALHEAAVAKTKDFGGNADSYPVRLFRRMVTAKLSPNSRVVAGELLKIAPTKDNEVDAWLGTGVQTCSASSDKELSDVIRFRDSLPPLLARAVKLVPNQMDRYIEFNISVATVVDEDFLFTLPSVCKSNRKAFLRSVNRLQPRERAWMLSRVIDLRTCKRIKLRED